MTDQIQIIVLAAGQGQRMNNHNLPKVLIPLKGKPMIQYLMAAIKESGVCQKPVVVVGQKAEQVKAILGPDYIYVFQAEQLGTGHAVNCAQEIIKDKAENVVVLYGDHPFISAELIKNLVQTHIKSGAVLTMVTARVSDFLDWRKDFSGFGRIIRDDSGNVCQIVENKDATEEQKQIKEVNPAYFCFKADWLWQNLEKLKNNNSQGEYYLTDLVGFACRNGEKISTVEIKPQEALGVNTAEQLELLEKILA